MRAVKTEQIDDSAHRLEEDPLKATQEKPDEPGEEEKAEGRR